MKARIFIYILMVAIAVPGAFAARRRAAAKPKFTTEELEAQTRQAFLDYDIATAREKLAALSADKKADPAIVDSLKQRIERMNEMIQRVQDIAVIDSFNVGRTDFFRFYRLSAEAGRLLAPGELPEGMAHSDETVVYTPEEGSLMIWGTDSGLVESRRLTDGSWDEPQGLGENVNMGGTANYPFLLSDGSTLYFATDGEDSLGGLDLYVTQRRREGFALPQNMGMPYNSPYDDYMLAIDEETGAGWFATDRNRLTDSVTVYVFVPTEVRININIDDPTLSSRAKIGSLTSPLSAQQTAVLERIKRIDDANNFGEADNSPDFEFPLPNGRILTRWDQFRSPTARRLMENYIDAVAEAEADDEELQKLRLRYQSGDKNIARLILSAERKSTASRQTLKKLANQVIQAETGK